MNTLNITNFNFSVLNSKQKPLGAVSINTDGELKVSKGLTSSLPEAEILKLVQKAIKAYIILTGKEPLNFSLQDDGKFYKVIKKNLRRKSCIGRINKDDRELVFELTFPNYLRTLCVQRLASQNGIEFYFNNHLYGGVN